MATKEAKGKKVVKRTTRKVLAAAFKTRPYDLDGISNPLTAEDKKTKRAFVVAIAIEVDATAEKSKLDTEAKNLLMVEAVAGSDILYKRDSKFKDETTNAEGQAGGYADFGFREMDGDNSYYKKYQANVDSCRKFSKLLVKNVIQKQKEMK